MIGFLAHLLGLNDPAGPIYLWWSGSGSDLGELAVVLVVWRHLNCHTEGCWRLAIHHHPTTGVRACRRHLDRGTNDHHGA